MAMHPVLARAATFPVTGDMYQMAERQVHELDAALATLEQLLPGDPTVEDCLRQAGILLASIETNFGRVHGWSLRCRHTIYRHARRLLGESQLVVPRPSWTETA